MTLGRNRIGMIRSIWAATKDGVIGRAGSIPWRYKGDLARFKRMTTGGVVIMGRLTYESIGKALRGRTNIVVTSSPIAMSASASGDGESTSIMRATSVEQALSRAYDEAPGKPFWFIGGARIYAAAMAWVDKIDVTTVPDDVPVDGSVLAPRIDPSLFEAGVPLFHPDVPGLTCQTFTRRNP
jgi:dihydrofolate reductase